MSVINLFKNIIILKHTLKFGNEVAKNDKGTVKTFLLKLLINTVNLKPSFLILSHSIKEKQSTFRVLDGYFFRKRLIKFLCDRPLWSETL